ncbi:Rid family hydrolase [Streptomyces sp. URMC 129]|uniref:Rid family hydrolase n=1 Tax=Streptomyces sp. URMC 129 TaxID=3423407 RepID=UPI003F1A9749
MSVERAPDTGSWDEALGAARVVAAGDLVLVGGTLPPATGAAGGDPYEQARSALAEAIAALERFGLGADSVIRTRIYISHARDAEEVARAHQDLLGSVRPVATLVLVGGFADSRALVQVELEAYRGAAT